ncbi:hypothetical protein HS7_04910 [Sulfolobales archaeon HS-7]|nr:hypothetical protein HS7_04910 [Sulfolobales archaeon HS-7]
MLIMARVNVAADEKIVEQLEDMAKKKGYTMFFLTNVALKLVLEVLREGEDLSTLEALIELFKITKSINVIPVTAWYLDNVSVTMFKESKEEFDKICSESGEQLGLYLKLRAKTLTELLQLYEKVKPVLPISSIVVREVNGDVEMQVSGTGFSRESTYCASKSLKRLLEAFGMKVSSVESSPGGIILARFRPE